MRSEPREVVLDRLGDDDRRMKLRVALGAIAGDNLPGAVNSLVEREDRDAVGVLVIIGAADAVEDIAARCCILEHAHGPRPEAGPAAAIPERDSGAQAKPMALFLGELEALRAVLETGV